MEGNSPTPSLKFCEPVGTGRKRRASDGGSDSSKHPAKKRNSPTPSGRKRRASDGGSDNNSTHTSTKKRSTAGKQSAGPSKVQDARVGSDNNNSQRVTDFDDISTDTDTDEDSGTNNEAIRDCFQQMRWLSLRRCPKCKTEQKESNMVEFQGPFNTGAVVCRPCFHNANAKFDGMEVRGEQAWRFVLANEVQQHCISPSVLCVSEGSQTSAIYDVSWTVQRSSKEMDGGWRIYKDCVRPHLRSGPEVRINERGEVVAKLEKLIDRELMMKDVPLQNLLAHNPDKTVRVVSDKEFDERDLDVPVTKATLALWRNAVKNAAEAASSLV